MCHRCIRSSLRSLPTRRKARGAATLIVALTLLGGMLLVLVAANRGLLLELRMATNQVRATTAFEAASLGASAAYGLAIGAEAPAAGSAAAASPQ